MGRLMNVPSPSQHEQQPIAESEVAKPKRCLETRRYIYPVTSVKMQRRRKDDVSPNELAPLLKLLEELLVADGLGGTLELVEQLAQPADPANDRAFEQIDHLAQLREGLALAPGAD
eukprot:1824701-Pleurochrysis_carterae.AAC.1